ncbi:MAG: type II toxin-antitoxin system PrlF family antitoxin [Pseudomonadota bacterium]
MIASKITQKGQVTIPKKIREFLNIGTSDKIIFFPLDEGQVLVTTERKSPEALFGLLKHRKKEKCVSIREMDMAIGENRQKRNL